MVRNAIAGNRESQHLAERLIRETLFKEGIHRDQLTIHSDRGPAMRSQAVAQLLATLGVTKSHSRPYVSDDNPFSESQFKTLYSATVNSFRRCLKVIDTFRSAIGSMMSS